MLKKIMIIISIFLVVGVIALAYNKVSKSSIKDKETMLEYVLEDQAVLEEVVDKINHLGEKNM